MILRIFWSSLFVCYAFSANAACLSPSFNWKFNFKNETTQVSDGAPCKILMPISTEPIYGTEIIERPKYGKLSVVDRTTILYQPNAKFKGNDSYVFEWIGTYRGTRPMSAKVRVNVAVK